VGVNEALSNAKEKERTVGKHGSGRKVGLARLAKGNSPDPFQLALLSSDVEPE
jgi:hypothetical protein